MRRFAFNAATFQNFNILKALNPNVKKLRRTNIIRIPYDIESYHKVWLMKKCQCIQIDTHAFVFFYV